MIIEENYWLHKIFKGCLLQLHANMVLLDYFIYMGEKCQIFLITRLREDHDINKWCQMLLQGCLFPDMENFKLLFRIR